MSIHSMSVLRRVLSIVISGLLLVGAMVVLGVAASPAHAADPPEPDPRTLPTVTGAPLSTWQTNGVVYAVETVGNVVYAGGNFTAVRPPGAAAGQQQVPRKNIAAFDATTGALLPFSHTFRDRDYPIPSNGAYDKTCSPGSQAGTYTCDTVYEIRASRDGSRIYVGGDFTQVDGQGRGNLAAFSTASNALLSWRVTGITGRVRALTVSGDTVYFGGSFSQAGGETRSRLAAADAETGALRPWAPTADKLVITMAMSSDDSRVILGGQFDQINGASIHGLAAVSSADAGESTRWDSRPIPSTSYVTDLSVSGDVVYASANGEGGGVFDGRLAANTATGEILWRDVCLGATWAIEVAGDLVYSGSHAHDCSSTPGGFPEAWNVSPPQVPRYYRLLAQTRSGETAPFIQHWFPTTNGGIVGMLGPRDMTWTGQQLWVAGEFTTVNGAPQQGLTRFGMAPAATSAAPQRPTAPTLNSPRPGEVRVSWPATEDIDNPILTYTVLRGATTGAMTPIGTVVAASKPWQRPLLRFRDTTATSGDTYVYQVQATDPTGVNSTKSFAASVTVASNGVDAYADRVLDSDPTMYWRMTDPPGSSRVTPTIGVGGVAGSGTTFGVAGAVADVAPGDTAVRTSGSSSGVIGAEQSESGSDEFSAEVWFRTTTRQGGKLLGFGSSQTGSSGSYDRHVYLRSDGRLVFGVYPGSAETVTSPAAYRDGSWHHLVVSLSSAGMRMYVDGATVASRNDVVSAQAYTGYWRLGSDNLGGWPNVSSSSFQGDLDEFAIYDRALPPSEVLSHRIAGVVDTSPPSTPSITSGGAGGTTVALGWTAANDDVYVTGYEVHQLSSSGGTPSAATLVTTTTGTSVTVPGVASGTGYWTVVALDNAGNRSNPATSRRIDVGAPAAYPQAVLAGSPDLYWRLDETSGSTINALVGSAATRDSGVSLNGPGVVPGSPGVSTSGTSRGVIAATTATTGPQTFTAQAWFRTSTTRGGKILGFSSSRSGGSSNYDRHVYLLDDGTLVFGVYPGYAATVTSARSYNDGRWHHVAASLGADGMRLMVDGEVVGADAAVTSAQDYTGYWRLGGDTTWGGATSDYFAGSIDEFTTYPRQLSVAEVQAQVAASGIDSQAPSAPGALEVVMSGDDAALTWEASADNLGVTSYEVHRSEQSGFTPSAATLVTSVPTAEATDLEVPPGTWYYRVVAQDAAGNSSAPSAQAVVISSGPDSTPPSTPGNVQASAAGQAVDISWDASSDDDAVERYAVHRGSTADFAPTSGNAVGSTTETSLREEDVPPGQWYYRIVAVDRSDNASGPSASAAVEVEPPDTTAPAPPTGMSVAVAGRTATLSWQPVTDPSGIARYLVYRLPSADAPPDPGHLVATTTSTGTTESDVPAGTWYYRVAAEDGAGNLGAASAAASAVISGTPVSTTLAPEADTWVDSTQPSRNFSNAWALTADATPSQEAHLKFAVPAAPPGRSLVSAVLRVTTSEQTWSGSPDPAYIGASADATWVPTALTWESRPPLSEPVLGTLVDATDSLTAYDIELDPAALASRLASTVDLVLWTESSNGFQFVSNEGALANRPRLILTFD